MRINIVTNFCVAVCGFGLSSVFAAPVIPIAPGTTWRYNMTEEIGKGLNVPDVKADPDGNIRLAVLYRVEGTEDVDGKDLLKFEMHRAGTITNTDLFTVDEHGITCWARVNLDGVLVKFSPGVGIVKDVTTMQDAKGDLLQRISLELAEGPKIVERPEVKSDTAPKRLAVSLAKDRFGKPTMTFSSNTSEIYARWQGQRLR